MEMTLESLTAKGIAQEVAKEILAAHKAAVTGNYIPKARFDEVNTQLTNANAQIQERDTQIAGLKKFEGDNAALQKKITDLEAANKTKADEMQAALLKERKTSAMKFQLTGKVHDMDMVLGQIDLEKVGFDKEGNLTGFEDQLKPLKESKKFLFVEETPKPNPLAGMKIFGNEPPNGGGPNDDKNNTPEAFGKALAQRRLAAQKQAAEAQKHYF